jgi:hypothetical protein
MRMRTMLASAARFAAVLDNPGPTLADYSELSEALAQLERYASDARFHGAKVLCSR